MLRGLFLSALLSTSALADGVSVPGLPPFAGSHAAVMFPPSSGGGSGSLSGAYTNLGAGPTALNLTTLTSTGIDYIALTASSATTAELCNKTGGGSVIGNPTVFGSGGSSGTDTQAYSYSFTDGQADPNGTGCGGGGTQTSVTNGIYYGGATGYGFTITAPASLTSHVFTVYAGADSSGTTLNVTVSLSDASAAPYTNTSCTTASGWVGCKYVITYNAAANGQTLTFKAIASSSGYNGFTAATYQ